jgi:hypothetical protein
MPARSLLAVIEDVLRTNGSAMTPREVLDQIQDEGTYPFSAKSPLGVVRNCLWRHCFENNHDCSSPIKRFHRHGDRYSSSTVVS